MAAALLMQPRRDENAILAPIPGDHVSKQTKQ